MTHPAAPHPSAPRRAWLRLHGALMPDYNRKATAYWWTMLVLGLGAWLASAVTAAGMPALSLLQIAAGVALAMLMAMFPLKIPRTNQVFSLGDMFIVLLLLTHGASAGCLAAGLETLRLVRESDYLERITALGVTLRAGLAERAAAAGFGLRQTGPGVMPLFLFDDDPDLRKGFCFASEMLSRGVYTHPWHNMFLCAAMTPADIQDLLDAAEASLAVLKRDGPTLAPVAKLAFLSAGAR